MRLLSLILVVLGSILVGAQSPPMLPMVGFNAASSGPPAAIAIMNTDHGTVNNTNYIFGTPAANRMIAVALATATTGTTPAVSAVSIGGISASLAVRSGIGTNPNADTSEIWIASVPLGVSGNINITSSPTVVQGISVYSLTGMASITPSNTLAIKNLNISISGSITIPNNGLLIAVVSGGNPTVTMTWGGGPSKNTDFIYNSTASTSAASEGPIAGTTQTISASSSNTGSSQSLGLAAASWSP